MHLEGRRSGRADRSTNPGWFAAEHGIATRGIWVRLSRWIKAKHRPIWIVTALLLIVGAAGVTQLNAVGVAQSDLVLGTSEARGNQVALGEHFAAGSGSPSQ